MDKIRRLIRRLADWTLRRAIRRALPAVAMRKLAQIMEILPEDGEIMWPLATDGYRLAQIHALLYGEPK